MRRLIAFALLAVRVISSAEASQRRAAVAWPQQWRELACKQPRQLYTLLGERDTAQRQATLDARRAGWHIIGRGAAFLARAVIWQLKQSHLDPLRRRTSKRLEFRRQVCRAVQTEEAHSCGGRATRS